MTPTATEPLVKTVRMIPPTIIVDETPKVKRQLRTAAYCRVSTDSDEQELSFDAQVEAYTDKIMSNPDWSLVGIFADEGISGTQAYKRKDFMKMIRMCRQGKIDQIITKSVSRFARNTVDCLNFVRELKELGIPVIFEKEGLNTMHMTSEIYISMHGIFAQSESESLSGNVKWGKQKSAEKGNVAISYKNFLGYRKGADGQPEIVPEEAETVVMIYDWFLDGDSIRTIKHKLEAAGRLSPTGKTTWSDATIRSILTNEKYKGDALLCKTYIVNCITKESKKNTDRPQYYVTNNHPAIIPREKFDRVQMELARRNSLKKKKQTGVKTELGKYSSKYALTELLICGKCGTAYRRSVWSKNGKKKAVWRCISRMEYGTKYCSDSPTIEETVIHRAVVEAIREVANDGGCQLAIKNLQTHIRMYYGGNDDNSLAADELRLNQLIAEVMNRAKQTDAASDEFLALSQEIAETKKRIAEKKAQQMTAHANEARMNDVLGTLDALKNHPIDYDDIIARKLIDCIKVMSKSELLIVFKGGIEKTVSME